MKMKATDLMIGDLVTYTGDDEGPITASIEGINEDSDFGVEILGTCERIEDIEPIPLTAEILEKNGWTKNSIFMELDADENTQFSWANRCGAVLYKNGWHHCDCEYVHTLQHALRLCGLNDLADNFKI